MQLDDRREGDWLRIKFWDHCIEETRAKYKKKPILCEVAGYLVEATPHHIIISFWRCHHPDKETQKQNTEELVIVRNTITEWGFANVDRWYSPGR